MNAKQCRKKHSIPANIIIQKSKKNRLFRKDKKIITEDNKKKTKISLPPCQRSLKVTFSGEDLGEGGKSRRPLRTIALSNQTFTLKSNTNIDPIKGFMPKRS